MGFWSNLKSGGLGKSGGLEGLFEEAGEALKKKDISVKDIAIRGPIPTVHNEFKQVANETKHKVRRKVEVIANNIDSGFGTKVENFYKSVEKIETNFENISDAINPNKILERTIKERKEFKTGDHLYVQRVGYTHHGIYLGGEKVIHYLDDEGICIHDLETFSRGVRVHVKNSYVTYEPSRIVERAFSRIGEKNYNVVSNNCEHFANWCRSGRDYDY
ncbi:hypothetical protein D3P08_03730 [Paenibacillus nanensis]|uniref:LRAT domain-containing protein n=1 Tax=Paenibacillus nanensis TaxID=393251 RepID=A0A3A1VG85_9BACL|nr:lecithin retinol acyltransferase family protein [Paenibacillus nanensis]RIX59275.1 hypothetical protein D3P08_03730 [Paenibacillus nanensis]